MINPVTNRAEFNLEMMTTIRQFAMGERSGVKPTADMVQKVERLIELCYRLSPGMFFYLDEDDGTFMLAAGMEHPNLPPSALVAQVSANGDTTYTYMGDINHPLMSYSTEKSGGVEVLDELIELLNRPLSELPRYKEQAKSTPATADILRWFNAGHSNNVKPTADMVQKVARLFDLCYRLTPDVIATLHKDGSITAAWVVEQEDAPTAALLAHVAANGQTKYTYFGDYGNPTGNPREVSGGVDVLDELNELLNHLLSEPETPDTLQQFAMGANSGVKPTTDIVRKVARLFYLCYHLTPDVIATLHDNGSISAAVILEQEDSPTVALLANVATNGQTKYAYFSDHGNPSAPHREVSGDQKILDELNELLDRPLSELQHQS